MSNENMLIVTQSRKGIINMENVSVLRVERKQHRGEVKYCISAYDTRGGVYPLGIYHTEERALQVLRIIALYKSWPYWMPSAEEGCDAPEK